MRTLKALLLTLVFFLVARMGFAHETPSVRAPSTPKTRVFRLAGSLPKLSENPGHGLWTVTNSWSEDWEKAFSQWVENEVGADFFSKHGIATDCADAAYGLRWIFSRMNGLPAAATLESGVLMTQDTLLREWVKLPTASEWSEDQRFLAALNFLMEQTYTHSLPMDTYPVVISADYVTAGALDLNLNNHSGHTMIVKSVDTKKRPYLSLFASTVPREARELIPASFWIFSYPKQDEGFRRFRWAVVQNDGHTRLKNAAEMPGYSEGQYTEAFANAGSMGFSQTVLLRLGVQMNEWERMADGVGFAVTSVLERVILVQAARFYCQDPKDCQPGSENDEAFSTPSRDARLLGLFVQLDQLAVECQNKKLGCEERWEIAKNSTQVALGYRTVTLGQVVQVFEAGTYSSDPTKPPQERWGLP